MRFPVQYSEFVSTSRNHTNTTPSKQPIHRLPKYWIIMWVDSLTWVLTSAVFLFRQNNCFILCNWVWCCVILWTKRAAQSWDFENNVTTVSIKNLRQMRTAVKECCTCFRKDQCPRSFQEGISEATIYIPDGENMLAHKHSRIWPQILGPTQLTK